jgi:hypothetical protein
MEDFIEMAFGNRFFELPFLEALSYIAALMLVGAVIVGLTRRLMGYSSEPSEAVTYTERPSYEEDTWEWRKAA